MSKLKANIAGVEFKNPIIAASGCFGFGREYSRFTDLSRLGGISVKGLTIKPREGNPPPRIAETPLGILNSVGLQNPGVHNFVRDELPFLRGYDVRVIANIAGNTVSEYIEAAEVVSEAGIDIIELNISCPNVRFGGMAFGVLPDSAREVTYEVKRRVKTPVMVKLSPNVTDICEIARAVEASGADAVSLINTILGMRIDINTMRPILKMNYGGLSGPAVFPVALRMVNEVYNAIKIPIVGMGGISCAGDAIEMMLSGAGAVMIGTVLFSDPDAHEGILKGIEKYMEERGLMSLSGLVGGVKLWES